MLGLVEGGPAGRAGLRPIQARRTRLGPVIVPESADLIVSIDGKPVKTYEELLTEVEAHAPGDDVVVGVIRNGKEVDVPVDARPVVIRGLEIARPPCGGSASGYRGRSGDSE